MSEMLSDTLTVYVPVDAYSCTSWLMLPSMHDVFPSPQSTAMTSDEDLLVAEYIPAFLYEVEVDYI